MKKRSNLALACSLICAAGSLWFAVSELFSNEESVPRRVVRVFLWLAACAVWTANLVMGCYARNAECAETDYIEQIEEDDFDE